MSGRATDALGQVTEQKNHTDPDDQGAGKTHDRAETILQAGNAAGDLRGRRRHQPDEGYVDEDSVPFQPKSFGTPREDRNYAREQGQQTAGGQPVEGAEVPEQIVDKQGGHIQTDHRGQVYMPYCAMPTGAFAKQGDGGSG